MILAQLDTLFSRMGARLRLGDLTGAQAGSRQQPRRVPAGAAGTGVLSICWGENRGPRLGPGGTWSATRAYVKGAVSHPDHKTIVLQVWHRVAMNTEGQAPAMQHVVFLD